MGGSAAEIPTPPDEQQSAPGLRASDADRDQVVAKLRDEYVAGRLSHDTFLHRVNVVLESRRQSELPPLVADLPAAAPGGVVVRWLRGTWSRVTGGGPAVLGRLQSAGTGRPRDTGPGTMTPGRRAVKSMTTSLAAAPGRRPPFLLQFPRAGGDRFSIGRDATCDLAIADMTVSRRHAQLERTPDGWLLSDLESTNGTRVNGWRVRGQVPVRVGDIVSFGSLDVQFSPLGDDPPGDPPKHGGGSAPP